MNEYRTDTPAASEYRRLVRDTFRKMSDRALAYQSSVIVGGIDREEVDREIARRERA
jgi:hypothetical protein